MDKAPEYPPIDHELATTVWPAMLALKAQLSTLSDDEYLAHVRSTTETWQPDVELGGAVEVEELTIPNATSGEDIPVLILRPAGVEGPLPCIYYTANGGKIAQSTRMGLTDVESRLVAELEVVLISISPRVGPRDPHPAQVEDAYTGLVWIAENATQLQIDRERIMIMGKSGGGGVAASTALYARDRGGPILTHQILIYPMIDDRNANVSSGYDVFPWTSANNAVGWRAILGDAAAGADVSPYAAAARADDLAGLPPTYLEVGSSEVFRDEVLDYGTRLAQTGVPVELHSWDGGFHAFEIAAPESNVARACIAGRTSYIERALRATAPR